VSDVLFLKSLLHERKRPLGRHEHGWEIEIRMNFTVLECGDVQVMEKNLLPSPAE
jgi:hypothetical protein